MERDDITYFLSGSNNPGEIRGVALGGSHVGVSVADLSPAGLAELSLYAGAPLQVFVDTGAFGEITFASGRPEVKKLITDAEWDRRIKMQERIVAVLGRQVHIVAPDMVGHQAETLERLERYADRVRAMRDAGANIIVPLQKGAMDLPTFFEAAAEVLGFDDFSAGVPMKKGATSLAELGELAGHLFWLRRPTRLHFLGIGPRSPRFDAALSTVRMRSPWTQVSCDSVRITAMVGRDRVTGLATRKYTAAQDALRAAGVTDPIARKAGGLIRILHDELRVELQAMRRAGWFDDELESGPGVPLEPGCIHYGTGGAFGTDLDVQLSFFGGQIGAG